MEPVNGSAPGFQRRKLAVASLGGGNAILEDRGWLSFAFKTTY